MVLTSYNAPEGSISFPEKKSIKSLFKIEGEGGGGVLSVIYLNYCMTHLGHSFYL